MIKEEKKKRRIELETCSVEKMIRSALSWSDSRSSDFF
jgi:hypothetical protein